MRCNDARFVALLVTEALKIIHSAALFARVLSANIMALKLAEPHVKYRLQAVQQSVHTCALHCDHRVQHVSVFSLLQRVYDTDAPQEISAVERPVLRTVNSLLWARARSGRCGQMRSVTPCSDNVRTAARAHHNKHNFTRQSTGRGHAVKVQPTVCRAMSNKG